LNLCESHPVCFFSRLPDALLDFDDSRLSTADIGSSTIWRYTTESLSHAVSALPHSMLSVWPEEAWFETTFEMPELWLQSHFNKRAEL
jgi:hypothetical protein